jgi:hypothetical protein
MQAGRKQHLDMLINLRGHRAGDARMSLGTAGLLPLGLGDFLSVAASKRRGLKSGVGMPGGAGLDAPGPLQSEEPSQAPGEEIR